jgi:hypothetical protein
MRKAAYSAILVVFVVWILVGSWYSWQSNLDNHLIATAGKQDRTELTDAQKREAALKEQELAIQQDIARFNHQLVFATWFLAIISSVTAVFALYFTLRTTQKAERAYVKMSHAPPGVSFALRGKIVINIDVRNFGRTPGRVTDVVINACTCPNEDRLPDNPSYMPRTSPGIPNAFLVSNDNFFYNSSIPLPEAEVAEVKVGNRQLYLLGYVDYIDQFGHRYRGGYGRLYRADFTGNNLIFIAQPGYNYDRPRLPGEGNDWD